MVRLPTRTVGEAHSLPLRRSRLGAPFGGAAERSEAEGVSWDEWYAPLVFTVPCRGRQLGDPPFPGAKHPYLPWKGVAERSESFKIMIAGGNHSTVERCRTNVRRRVFCFKQSSAREPLSQPVRAASSPFKGAKAASPLGSPGWRPLQGCGRNHWIAAANGGHSLRQPVRAASSLKEGAKGTSCQREAASLPYGCGGKQGA